MQVCSALRTLPLIEVQQLLGILPANLETMRLMLALIVIRDMCYGYAEFLCAWKTVYELPKDKSQGSMMF